MAEQTGSAVGVEQPMIEIRRLKKTYPSQEGPVVALDGIDLTIRRGEIYGVIGMSGAGKSTLVRCINLLEKPTGGSIVIDGQDVASLSGERLLTLRRSVSMIFQQFNLLMQRTALKNVQFPLEIAGWSRQRARQRALEMLKLEGLEDKGNAYPSQLSGGQKQRVAIARALATSPKVLLSDEATSALDPLTTRSILELLREINRRMGITIVVITHQMNVIREICSHVAVIDNAKIIESGTVEQVLENPDTHMAQELFSSFDDEGGAGRRRRYRIRRGGAAGLDGILAGIANACGEPVRILPEGDGPPDPGRLLIELPDKEEAVFRMRAYLNAQKIEFEEMSALVGQ